MAASQHAFDYLSVPEKQPPSGVWVLFGDDAFLKQMVRRKLERELFGDGQEESPTSFEGPAASWRDVADELRTRSLFAGGACRMVLVRDADPFVSGHRAQLEELAQHGGLPGVLLLDVTAWPGNTKLAAIVARHGRTVECRAPLQSGGRSKAVDTGRICEWLIAWGHSRHEIQLARKSAQLLLDLAGAEFGLLDQELAKLALFVPPHGKVSAELVADVVGGWKTKTAWEMTDAALDGDLAEALRQLDHLLNSGDEPHALFAQISWSLRRICAATRAYERAEAAGQRVPLRAALEQTGFQHWQTERAERQLKRLGRARAGQIFQWLLETDLALKGSHSSGHRARWALERLLLRMAGPSPAARTG
ncbi:MAG: DNA polymerase III subunit delta [Pirellulaceae bacterium]|nr:DNA polymerase III subunit delta [Pirellulaceae bacterium]